MGNQMDEIRRKLGFEILLRDIDKSNVYFTLIRNDGKREELCAESKTSHKTFSLLALSLFALVYVDGDRFVQNITRSQWKWLWKLDTSIMDKSGRNIFEDCPAHIIKDIEK